MTPRTRSVRDFVPRVPGQVGGLPVWATVQAAPHIGHLRSGVNYDVLRRWLVHSGLTVTFVRNITDIDDKILAVGAAEGVPFWSIAYANERAFTAAYERARRAAADRRAAGHRARAGDARADRRLIDAGHAYAAGPATSTSTSRTLPAYGPLSGQRSPTHAAADEPTGAKRDPRDFALWKGAKPGEPGPGTPRGAPAGRAGTSSARRCRRVPGADLRHPRRRAGPGLPAPRERDGPVARGRAAVRPLLGAPRAAQPRRREDEQVAGQRDRRRTCCGGGGRSSCATTCRRALPVHCRLLGGGAARGRGRLPADRGLRARAASWSASGQPGPLPAAFVAAMDDDLNTSAGAGGGARRGPGGQRRARRGGQGGRGRALRRGPGDARRARPRPAGRAVAGRAARPT